MLRRKEVTTLQKLCFNFVTTNMENPWFKQCVEVASCQLDGRYIISRFHSLRKSSKVNFEISTPQTYSYLVSVLQHQVFWKKLPKH